MIRPHGCTWDARQVYRCRRVRTGEVVVKGDCRPGCAIATQADQPKAEAGVTICPDDRDGIGVAEQQPRSSMGPRPVDVEIRHRAIHDVAVAPPELHGIEPKRCRWQQYAILVRDPVPGSETRLVAPGKISDGQGRSATRRRCQHDEKREATRFHRSSGRRCESAQESHNALIVPPGLPRNGAGRFGAGAASPSREHEAPARLQHVRPGRRLLRDPLRPGIHVHRDQVPGVVVDGDDVASQRGDEEAIDRRPRYCPPDSTRRAWPGFRPVSKVTPIQRAIPGHRRV